MNPARHHELEASLLRELDRQAVERGLCSTGRVAWLVDQIENYVERWLGLRAGAAQTIAPPSDDLFGMIEIGADAVSAELQALKSPAIAESWHKFLAVLAAVRAGSNAIKPQQLAESLAVVRCELHS
jgi:hypothetical protein